jgi:hypothetical protein
MEQFELFEGFENEWQKEWKDMPEYIQEDKEAIKRVFINFQTTDDIKLFNQITGLNVTMETKGLFFPKINTDKLVYVRD